MTRTALTLLPAWGAALLLLAACGGEVTDGGTGSDTDFERIEEMQDEGTPESEEIGGADSRVEDYPDTGEEMTRNPIEPGNEEPGGKDALTEEEREAIEGDPDEG